jgi:hypothetical protein
MARRANPKSPQASACQFEQSEPAALAGLANPAGAA